MTATTIAMGVFFGLWAFLLSLGIAALIVFIVIALIAIAADNLGPFLIVIFTVMALSVAFYFSATG